MVDRPQLQAPRGVQASGTNRTSPCTHPSSKEGRGLERMGLFASVAMRPPGSPWFRHAGESALHERDHRGGDHPIPFRTRQLSPPSPKVLQRQAAGGQGVALMQGASAYIQGLCPFFVASFGVPFTRKYRRCGGFIMWPYFSELQYNSIVSRIQRGWIDEQLAYSRGRRPA